MRGVAVRDEENPGKLHTFEHMMGDGQVAIVNRIETSTEKAEALWNGMSGAKYRWLKLRLRRVHDSPLRTRG